MINAVLLKVFILFQVFDGIFTWYGIVHTSAGIGYEVNPIVILVMQEVGVVAGLALLKILSMVACLGIYFFRKAKVFGMKPERHTLITLVLLNTLGVFLMVRHFMALEALANAGS